MPKYQLYEGVALQTLPKTCEHEYVLLSNHEIYRKETTDDIIQWSPVRPKSGFVFRDVTTNTVITRGGSNFHPVNIHTRMGENGIFYQMDGKYIKLPSNSRSLIQMSIIGSKLSSGIHRCVVARIGKEYVLQKMYPSLYPYFTYRITPILTKSGFTFELHPNNPSLNENFVADFQLTVIRQD